MEILARLWSKLRKKKTNIIYPLQDWHYIGTLSRWSGGATIKGKSVVPKKSKSQSPLLANVIFKLGMEYRHKTYVNQQSSNAIALNKRLLYLQLINLKMSCGPTTKLKFMAF